MINTMELKENTIGEVLVPDIMQIIFLLCPITDKRNFIRTCKTYSKLSALMPEIERNFQNMINDTKYLFFMKYSGFYNPLYKYTIELIYDGYANLIPEHYIVPENRVMYQYKKIYYRAALNGDLSMIRLLLRLGKTSYLWNNIDFVFRGAAKMGNMEILNWLCDNGYKFNRWTTACAAKGNQFETLKWLVDKGCKMDVLTSSYAAKIGNMEMLKWILNEKKCETDNYVVFKAVSKGHIDIVKWLHVKDPENLYNVCNIAAKFGHLDILKWGLDNGYRISSFTNAMEGGHIHILQWLKDNGYFRPKKTLCKYAAWAGNFECLKWGRLNDCPWDEQVCAKAAERGDLEMLKWLRENGCPWNKSTCHDAATGGHLEVLKWCRQNGCPWNKSTCYGAAWGGHLDVLKWARENGCDWNAETCSRAAHNGHFELLKWARENGCDWDADTCADTVKHDHFDILKWLKVNGCPWDEELCINAVEFKNLNILKWASDNGCKWGVDTYTKALTPSDGKIDRKIIMWVETNIKALTSRD